MTVLRATFSNQLEYVETVDDRPDRVYYQHAYRCPIKSWFEATDRNPYGWVLQFETQNSHVLKQFRSDIFRDAISYVERRAKRRAIEINFESIVNLAEATEVRSYESADEN